MQPILSSSSTQTRQDRLVAPYDIFERQISLVFTSSLSVFPKPNPYLHRYVIVDLYSFHGGYMRLRLHPRCSSSIFLEHDRRLLRILQNGTSVKTLARASIVFRRAERRKEHTPYDGYEGLLIGLRAYHFLYQRATNSHVFVARVHYERYFFEKLQLRPPPRYLSQHPSSTIS